MKISEICSERYARRHGSWSASVIMLVCLLTWIIEAQGILIVTDLKPHSGHC